MAELSPKPKLPVQMVGVCAVPFTVQSMFALVKAEVPKLFTITSTFCTPKVSGLVGATNLVKPASAAGTLNS